MNEKFTKNMKSTNFFQADIPERKDSIDFIKKQKRSM